MMRVYLDNNVFVDIENGALVINCFFKALNSEYYYSYAHISELLNGIDKGLLELKNKRLTTIESLCGSNFLFQDTTSEIRLALCKPKQAYENVKRFSAQRRQINQVVNSFTPDRAEILKELVLDSKEIGNYGPDMIWEVIENKLRESRYHIGIKEYLVLTEANTLSAVYASFFNLLDAISYKKDKNNVARLYDVSHAYYAQKCGVLVSNDVKMRAKAKAVYHYLGVNTEVTDAFSFLNNYSFP